MSITSMQLQMHYKSFIYEMSLGENLCTLEELRSVILIMNMTVWEVHGLAFPITLSRSGLRRLLIQSFLRTTFPLQPMNLASINDLIDSLCQNNFMIISDCVKLPNIKRSLKRGMTSYILFQTKSTTKVHNYPHHVPL